MVDPSLSVNIDKMKVDIETLQKNAQSISQEFINQSELFVTSWIDETATEVVKENYEVTKENGLEKLKKLKEDISNLQSRSSELVNKFLNVELDWVHKNSKYNHSDHYDKFKDFKDNLNKAFKSILGFLGDILSKYGYINFDKKCLWEKSFKDEPKHYYKHNIAIPENLKSLFDNYDKIMSKIVYEKTMLNIEIDKKNKEEAENLWSQAKIK